MKRIILFGIFFLFLTVKSFSQPNSFDLEVHKLFFHIFNNQPDSTVVPFVKRHFSYILEPKDSTSWSIVAPDSSIKPYKLSYTLKFNSHPYFNANFYEGHLIIHAEETETLSPRVTGSELSFLFKNKSDAQKAGDQIFNRFKIFIKSKRTSIVDNVKITELSTSTSMSNTNTIFYSISKLDNAKIGYKLTFKFGTYN